VAPQSMTSGTARRRGCSGTKLRVTVPFHSKETGPRILLIEDEPGLRSLIGFVLLRDGWIVDAAESGVAAISRLEHELPDLILLDLSMPEMDGWDVLARRSAEPRWREIPVVVMSADHQHSELVIELGATRFLPKPFTMEALRKVLVDYLPRGQNPESGLH
jgi:CheY-like chemotaxis protein